jgi:Caspase domain
VLHVLAVGVSKYSKLPADESLAFPAQDAEAFAAVMGAQKGRAYRDVQTIVLTNDQATQANIKRQLRQLRKQIGPQDVAMVFLSGHGAQSTKDWAFEPSDVDPEDDDSRLSGEDLNRLITNLPGIKVLFLDSSPEAALRDRGLEAYHSSYDKNRIINALTTAPTGVIVFCPNWPGSHKHRP